MGYIRRVTLRCLCDDLDADWSNVSEQRAFRELRVVASSNEPDSRIALALENVPTTARAAHPLVDSFFAAFASDDPGILRPTISGLSNPHWWKQKTGRWRGAATDAAFLGEGEVWLCAGGRRCDGDDRDFYNTFAGLLETSGIEALLPREEDRRVQEVEAKCLRRDAWLEQLRLSVLLCLAEVDARAERRSLHVPSPSPESPEVPLLHIEFELEREADSGDQLIELFMLVTTQDHSRPQLARLARETTQSVLEPVVDSWRVLPGPGTTEVWSVLLSQETLANCHAASSTGTLPGHLKESCPVLGLQAHYARKERIVHAIVEGDPVRGLCGQWFIPTANPDDLPLCPTCHAKHAELSR